MKIMARELKFRAWDKTLNKMCHVDVGKNYQSYNSVSDIELLQYTGLKDKNGVEIYERDILAYIFDIGGQIKQGYAYWSDDKFGWCLHLEGCGEELNFLSPCDKPGEYLIYTNCLTWVQLEVIGNIYENPELLEEEIKGKGSA